MAICCVIEGDVGFRGDIELEKLSGHNRRE